MRLMRSARGRLAKKFLFSLSLNPPSSEKVPIDNFEAAIEAIEERLGLEGQPRAIVFHEKGGRRHAHAVWSRIDADEMKAIILPFYKMKLREPLRKRCISSMAGKCRAAKSIARNVIRPISRTPNGNRRSVPVTIPKR